jgi:hypothetical protein
MPTFRLTGKINFRQWIRELFCDHEWDWQHGACGWGSIRECRKCTAKEWIA